MDQLPLTLPNPPPLRRRGRPPGARSKRSLDLGKYIEARFAGMTPGQQLAELGMVTAKEVRQAGSVAIAMALKARDLAVHLRCDTLDAMVILVKAQTELLGYVHQKQPMATAADAQQLPAMFLAAEGDMAASAADAVAEDRDAEIIEDFLAGEDQVAP